MASPACQFSCSHGLFPNQSTSSAYELLQVSILGSPSVQTSSYLLVRGLHSCCRCLSCWGLQHRDIQKLLPPKHSAFAAVQSKGLGQRLGLAVFHSELHVCMPLEKVSGNPSTCTIFYGLPLPTLDVPETAMHSNQSCKGRAK